MPPHERPWRHPSELAAEERAAARAETMPTPSRVVAFTGGILGVMAVGVLVLTVTPAWPDGPVDGGIRIAGSDGLTRLTVGSTTVLAGLRASADVFATPIEIPDGAGTARVAVATVSDVMDAVAAAAPVELDPAPGTPIDVAVPSGRRHAARIVGRVGDTVVVEISGDEPTLRVAARSPGPDAVVTVLADPPVTILLDDLDDLDVDEGTAVVDDGGHLIGLCTDRGGTTLLAGLDTTDIDELHLDTDDPSTDPSGDDPSGDDGSVTDGGATSDG